MITYFEKKRMQQAYIHQYQIDLLNDFHRPENKKKPKNKKITKIKIPYQRCWGLLKPHFNVYHKEPIDLSLDKKHYVDIITNTTGIGKKTFVKWHTSKENARKALNYNLLRSQTLTGKVIGEVGHYRLKAAHRALHANIISNKARQKELLVDHFQGRVKAFEAIERLINKDASVKKIKETITETIEKLETLKGSISLIEYGDYRKDIGRPLKKQIQAQIDRLTRFSEKIDNKKGINDKLFNVLRREIKYCLYELEGANQILAYNRKQPAGNRGDLESYIIDALREVDRYPRDLENPITKKHQYYFDRDIVSIDSRLHGNNNEDDLKQFLLGVSLIEGTNKIDYKTRKIQFADGTSKKAKKTAATKWRHFSLRNGHKNPDPMWKRVGRFFWNNIFPGVLIFVADFLETLLLGNHAGFCERAYWKATNQSIKGSDYKALISHLKNKKVHLSTRLGLVAHQLIFNSLWESVIGVFEAIASAIVSLSKVIYDFKNGWWRKIKRSKVTHDDEEVVNAKTLDTKALLETLKNEFKHIKNIEKREKRKLRPKLRYIQKKRRRKTKIDVVSAIPPYYLTPYVSKGLLNTGADGAIAFMELFEHHLFRQNPSAGLLFLILYTGGAFSALFPQLMHTVVGKVLVNLSNDFGRLFAQGNGMWVSAGFTEGKVVAGLWQFMLNGPDSWAAKGGKNFFKDPAAATIYIAACIALGTFFTYVLDIPGLDLDEEIGTFPPFALAFVGLKGGVGLYELVAVNGQTREQKMQEFREYFLKFCEEKKGAELTPDEKDTINLRLEEILTGESLDSLNKYFQEDESVESKQKINLLLLLAEHQANLPYLSIEAKEALTEQLPKLLDSRKDAAAITKLFNPVTQHTPLKNFFTSILSYPVLLLRCALSPISGTFRPWVALWEQFVDDFLSTYHAVNKLLVKSVELLVNRPIRVIMDIVSNQIIARIAGVFGSHEVTRNNYKAACAFDNLQDKCKSNTTDLILNKLKRLKTTPVAEVSIKHQLSNLVYASTQEKKSYELPKWLSEFGIQLSEVGTKLKPTLPSAFWKKKKIPHQKRRIEREGPAVRKRRRGAL